jgi:hypothetical protein
VKRVADEAGKEELLAVESIKKLLKAGMELGVAEATRRLTAMSPGMETKPGKAGITALLGGASVVEVIQFVKNDPTSVFHLAKEVWSRGGATDKNRAAEAIGTGLGFFVPHKAIEAARELAAMARSPREADMIGKKAIEPVLERNPALIERVKKFLEDNERLLRQAAIAGLVGYVARRRKYAAVGVELLLLVAQRNEKELRAAVKYGLRKMMEVDPKATANAVFEWVRSDPTKERVQSAATFVAQRATDVKLALEKGVFTALAKYASSETNNGNGTTAKATKTSKGSRSKAKPKKTTRKPKSAPGTG